MTGSALGRRTDGTILRTQDSGNTWQALSNGSKSRLFAVTFQGNGQSGWAVGTDGTILRTRDGGDTWQAQWRYHSELHAVTFTDDGRVGWIVGDDGIILSTSNGVAHGSRRPMLDTRTWFYASAFLVLAAAIIGTRRIRNPSAAPSRGTPQS